MTPERQPKVFGYSLKEAEEARARFEKTMDEAMDQLYRDEALRRLLFDIWGPTTYCVEGN